MGGTADVVIGIVVYVVLVVVAVVFVCRPAWECITKPKE